jgi:hypothetical protein
MLEELGFELEWKRERFEMRERREVVERGLVGGDAIVTAGAGAGAAGAKPGEPGVLPSCCWN